MKLLSALCFIGLAAASSPNWQWQTGKEHTFEYSGRLLTGIPQLASHFSGLGIKCHVSLQIKSMDDLRLTLTDVRFSRVNGKLSPGSAVNPDYGTLSSRSESSLGSTPSGFGLEGSNWRNVLLPEFSHASQQIKTLLNIPVSFSVQDGEIKAMTVSGAEEEWSLNFKKALVVLFQTKMEKSNLDLELNSINKGSFETKNYWKVSEETIDGVCDVIYQVNELPEYLVKEQPENFPRMEACPSSKYFEIVKTKEIESCKKSPIYRFMKPSMTGSASGCGCESVKCMPNVFGTASSVTRYYACGSRSNLILQSIVNEGELTQKPVGIKTESVITGTRQVLRLKSVETIRRDVPMPSQPRTLESLMYEYIATGETLRSQIGMIPKIPQSELKNSYVYKYLPRNFLPNPSSQRTQEKLNPQKVMMEMKRMFHQVMEDLTSVQNLPEKQIPEKITSIVRAFTFLKFEDMKSLYEELKTECSSGKWSLYSTEYSYHHGSSSSSAVAMKQKLETLKNLFFDSLTVSGTTPAVLFLKEMIRTEEMSVVQATTVLALLPHHIITPSKEVFTSLFELIQSNVIKSNPILYNTAILSFSNLVQKVCLDGSRKMTYPVSVFGEFCDPQSEIVIEKWIPFLTHELKTSTHNPDKHHLIIMALGALSHKNVIPTLLPLIEGSMFESHEHHHRSVSRFLSVYALSHAGARHPELVLPVLFSVFNNPAENTEIRIASFNVMMKLNPPMVFLQKIAAATWTEKDTQVLKTCYSTIQSIANENQILSLEIPTPSSNIVKKCQLVLPLLKKISTGYLPTSASIYTSDYMPKMDAGYMGVFSWISNYKSLIPSDIFSKFEYLLGERQFKAYEFAFKMHGSENLFDKFESVFSPLSVKEESESLSESEINKLPEQEKRRILEARSRKNVVGGRYTSESRRQSEEEFERRNVHQQFSSSFDQVKHQLHSEWAKVIENLKIESRRNGPLASLVYLNLFDDVSFFGSISEISTQMIREKIAPLLANPMHYSSKVCGKTPINFQRMMNVAPTEHLIPSEMGFPVIMETNMPVTISIRGHIDINCESSSPSFTMDTQIMSTNHYHAIVGTFCPFTEELVATGYKEDMVLNLPAKTQITWNAPASKVKVIVTPVHVSHPVDVLHFSTKPFTVRQNYYELTPKTLSTHMKLIETATPLKKMELPFGSSMGLNMKSVIETESRYLDLTYIMQLAKMYNYNPMNMIRFVFSPASISEKTGNPSICRHSYRLVYDPLSSKTKEIEMTFTMGVATKRSQEEPLYHSVEVKTPQEMKLSPTILGKINPYIFVSRPISEQVHASRQGILHKVMTEKMELKSGMSFMYNFHAVLKGSVPRTFSYQIVGGFGTDKSLEQKWHLRLENNPTSSVDQKICIDGSANIPSIPTWDIDMIRSSDKQFHFYNVIGFGKTCTESLIKVTGSSKVSARQVRYSKESPVAVECRKLIERGFPGALTSFVCQKTHMLAKTLDEVDFKIMYVNTPPRVHTVETKIIESFKAFFWPYIKNQESFVPSLVRFRENREVSVSMRFDKSTETLDMTLNRPEEMVTFHNLRIPYPFNTVFPMVLGESNTLRGLQSMTGHSLYPVCNVEKIWLKTFDNRSIPLKMDDCYHLISGDCSPSFRFGVLAKAISHNQQKELKIFLNKTEIILRPSTTYSQYLRHLEVIVNGSHVSLEKDTTKVFKEENYNTEIFELYKSKDSVIRVSAPKYYLEVKFDGERISIQSSQMLKNKLCGICGDSNQQKTADLKGPKKCIYSKPELEIASYRISSPSCSTLEGSIKERLESENQQCAKYQEIPTELHKSFMALVGKCSRSQHIVMERSSDETCFSRVPIIQCGAQCTPKPRQLVSKTVAFTCMRNGRIAEYYREKVAQGELIPELGHKEESFSTSILVPQSCVSVTSGHPMIPNSGIPTTMPSSGVSSGNSYPMKSHASHGY